MMKHILSAQVLAAVLRASSTPLFSEMLVAMSADRERAAFFRDSTTNAASLRRSSALTPGHLQRSLEDKTQSSRSFSNPPVNEPQGS